LIDSVLDGGKTGMALKTMSISKLQDLKAKVDAAIAQKVSERRHELEGALSKLLHLDGRGRVKATRGGPRGAVAPKYRNPEDPSQTWAGRGLRPRWLVAAMKSGKKLDDFLISGTRKKRK
jgi:DNA-binding protein H-NS